MKKRKSGGGNEMKRKDWKEREARRRGQVRGRAGGRGGGKKRKSDG